MAIYKRETKRGVRYDLCYYDDRGKQRWKTFRTKKEALDYEAKVQVAKKENRYQEVFDVRKETLTTFNELADKYEENYPTQKCYKGFKDYMIKNLREEFGYKKLSQITYLDLETWRNKRKATPTRGGQPRAAGSVNGELAVFSHMMNKAVEWGLLETSPFKKGKPLTIKVDNTRTRFLSGDEIVVLLKQCPLHLRPIVEVALHTGMRRGELLSLKWEQINHGFIHLDGAMTKSGKGRKIPVNDDLKEILKKIRQKHQLKSPYVFCDSKGNRFQEVKRSFNAACKRAGIEDFRFHDLRHTFASRLVMRGATIKAVQELLGHADLSMTMRYAHLSQEHLKDTVNLLNSPSTLDKHWITPSPTKKADSLPPANLS